MGISRNVLLWVSRSQKLRETLPRYGFIRRSVSRFMPGEHTEDALDAAAALQKQGLPTVLTHLGENVTTEQETQHVKEHYLKLLDEIHRRGIDAHISVKLTELGLDQDPGLCLDHMRELMRAAADRQNYVWVDMEGSKYTTSTLDLYYHAREEFGNTGLCLQSYLYRTKADLDKLLPVQPGIRLVKGAYAEPPTIAFASKNENDENYFNLSRTLLLHAKEQGIRIGFGTHDQALVQRIADLAKNMNVPGDKFEIQMLYGIRRDDQMRLVKAGCRVRVLISYGTYWFPWYMRRLAERPANVWFVLRNLF